MDKPIQELKMNLQLFSDEDYTEATETYEDMEEVAEEVEEVNADTETTEPDYTDFLKSISSKAKYNGEPLNIDNIEELITRIEKGSNYDKIKESKLSLEEKLSQLESSSEIRLARELAQKYGYNSVDEYEKAVKESWEQEQLDELIQNNIPDELAKEILESRKEREERRAEKEANQEKEKTSKMYEEFFSEYPELNTPEEIGKIPGEVWARVEKGMDITKAYSIYKAKSMNTVKVEAEQEAIKAMLKNGEESTGSIDKGTASEETKMSIDQVNALLKGMTSQEQDKWATKNYKNLEKWGYFNQ